MSPNILLVIITILLIRLRPSVIGTQLCSIDQQVCGAQVRLYASPSPPQEPPQQLVDEDGSGWEIPTTPRDNTPLYDEFFDTNEADEQLGELTGHSEHEICECPSNGSVCPFSNSSSSSTGQLLKLDSSLTLAFCDEVTHLIRHHCRGTRSLIRVIGELDPNGRSLNSVTEALVFCRCPGGYRRLGIEPWLNNHYAIVYQCASQLSSSSTPPSSLSSSTVTLS